MPDPYGICDRCGFKFYLNQLRTEWTGLKVCHDCYDPRHPQEAVRAVNDTQGVRPGMRPRPADVFTTEFIRSEDGSLLIRENGMPMRRE